MGALADLRRYLLGATSLPGLVGARIVTPASSRRGRRIHNGGRGWPDAIRPPAVVVDPMVQALMTDRGWTDVMPDGGR